MMFKYLPDAEIEWRDTWLGALITAALFIVGKQVIGLYLGQTTVASSFGAAASVVIFMIWVYYAARDTAVRRRDHAGRRGAARRDRRADGERGAGAAAAGAASAGEAASAPHSKLKMSSLSGRSIPASWCSSQICAHGRPYMSGTLYSTTSPGDAGVARPSIGIELRHALDERETDRRRRSRSRAANCARCGSARRAPRGRRRCLRDSSRSRCRRRRDSACRSRSFAAGSRTRGCRALSSPGCSTSR